MRSLKEERISYILRLLRKRYPRPKTALDYSNPLQILVATILSAQCTDARVNIVTKPLFKKYKRAGDYARAKAKALERQIHSTGFYRNKARNIIAAAKMIEIDFAGRVPDSMEKLIRLPGVARKTANIVLFEGYGKVEGIAVDTHVRRLSRRLGLSKENDPDKIERDLMKITPRKEWGNLSHRLILHGRNTCIARRPKCGECLLQKVCPSKISG